MARRPPLPTPSALRRRRSTGTNDSCATARLPTRSCPAAGLVGHPVRDPNGVEVGRVIDVVVRWHGEPYPPVTGVVVRVGRRRAYVPIDQVEEISTERE